LTLDHQQLLLQFRVLILLTALQRGVEDTSQHLVVASHLKLAELGLISELDEAALIVLLAKIFFSELVLLQKVFLVFVKSVLQ